MQHARLLSVVCLLSTAARASDEPAQTGARPDEERKLTPLAAVEGAKPAPRAAARSLADSPEARAAYEPALRSFESGDYAGALARLVSIGEDGERIFECQLLLARTHARLANYDQARTAAAHAATLRPQSAAANFLVGSLAAEAGDLETAVAHLRAATLTEDDGSGDVSVPLSWNFLGECLAQLGYWTAAVDAYGHFDALVWDSHPELRNAREIAAILAQKPHGGLVDRVRLLNLLRQPTAVVAVTRKAIATWPQDAFVARLHGRALLEAELPAEAYEFARHGLGEHGVASGLTPIAVDAALALDKLDDWIKSLAPRAADEDGARVSIAAAARLVSLGHSEAAARLARAALERRPSDASLAWQLADALRAAGRLREATQALIEFVRQNPAAAELCTRSVPDWAAALRQPGAMEALIADLSPVPRDDFAVSYVLAILAETAGQGELATKLLSEGAGRQAGFAAASVMRARLAIEKHDWPAALRAASAAAEQQPDAAAAYLVMGLAHAGLDQNAEAEKNLRKALKLRPTDVEVALALGRHLRRMGQRLAAERYFQEALTLDGANGEAFEELIDSYLAGEKLELARQQFADARSEEMDAEAYRRAATQMRYALEPGSPWHVADLRAQFGANPQDAKTALRLAALLMGRGRSDDAFEIAEGLLAREPDNDGALEFLAAARARLGEFGEAISLLEALRRRYPNRVPLLSALAELYRYEFRVADERRALERLIEADPEQERERREALLESHIRFGEEDAALRQIEAWVASGQTGDDFDALRFEALVSAARYSEAAELVFQMLNDNLNDPVARALLANLVVRADEPETLVDRIKALHDGAPSDEWATETLFGALLRAKRADEALELARELSGGFAESVRQRIWFGRCHAAAGRSDSAVAEFEALLSERALNDDQRAGVRLEFQRALHDARQYDRALDYAKRWLEQAGADPAGQYEALLYVGWAYSELGRMNEYADALERRLAFTPVDAGVLNDLGYTWVDQGRNVDKALEMIRLATRQQPLNGAFLDSLGWAHYKRGEFAEARKFLARTVRLREGRTGVTYDHLADAAFRCGDSALAKENWRLAIESLEHEREPRAEDRSVLERVRAKLQALETGGRPELAPTAAEQQAAKP